MRKAVTFTCLLVVLGCGGALAGVPHVESAAGEVVIRTVGPRHLFVLVDTARGARDGLVDQWFILVAEDAVQSPLDVHLPHAQLVHYPGTLRVTAADQRTVYEFVVPEHEENQPLPQHFQIVRNTGIGLSHAVAATPHPIARATRSGITTQADDCVEEEGCFPYEDFIWEGGGGGGSTTCRSGGPGSTSCSVSGGGTSCSVSCGPGYYACCEAYAGLPKCTCVKG